MSTIEAIRMDQIRKEQEEVCRWVTEGAQRVSGGGGSSSSSAGEQKRRGRHRGKHHQQAKSPKAPIEVAAESKIPTETLRKMKRELNAVLAKKSNDYRDVIDFTNNVLKYYRGEDPIQVMRQGSHIHFHREGVGSALLVRKHGEDVVYKPNEINTFGSALINLMLGRR